MISWINQNLSEIGNLPPFAIIVIIFVSIVAGNLQGYGLAREAQLRDGRK